MDIFKGVTSVDLLRTNSDQLRL